MGRLTDPAARAAACLRAPGWALAVAALAASPAALAGPRPQPGFEPALPPAESPPAPTSGAIYNAAAGYAPLTQGHRARAVGDPLTIVLVETTTASKSAGARTDRGGGFSITPPSAGPLSFLNPDALKAGGQSSFKGQGNAAQSHSLNGLITVTIAAIRPGGIATVRGEKRMMLSQGQEWIQFSGIVRLADVDADNRILSTRVADARVEYSGNGAVARASRPGWLARFFSAISPF